MRTRPVGQPEGAILVGSRVGVLANSQAGVPANAVPFVGGTAEYIPPADERHCQWMDGGVQCGSWPVRKPEVDNPNRYCAGHLRKANGANAPADQGLHQVAP